MWPLTRRFSILAYRLASREHLVVSGVLGLPFMSIDLPLSVFFILLVFFNPVNLISACFQVSQLTVV
jgi:hypothetical protein